MLVCGAFQGPATGKSSSPGMLTQPGGSRSLPLLNAYERVSKAPAKTV
jgi:hypothetical protein